jgi:hypothetical protein
MRHGLGTITSGEDMVVTSKDGTAGTIVNETRATDTGGSVR